MTLLTLDRVACSTPDGTPLFSDLTFSLARERVGLVGRNGAGKTTLLHAIAGRVPVAGGVVTRGGTVGLLTQLPPAAATVSEALEVSGEVERQARISRGVATEQDIADADWGLMSRLDAALSAAGLSSLDLTRSLSSLSGGERTRVMLASLMLPEREILLLDEPTNNLDDEGRSMVAELLRQWKGGAIVATHDRELLEDVDRILELTSVGVHIVGGGWTAFAEKRDAERVRAAEALRRAEAEVRDARRERQREVEKQARRDRAGRRAAAKDIDPRMFLYRQQQRAERSAARYRNVGDDLVRRASDLHHVARAEVETLAPISMELAPSNLPSAHLLVRAAAVVCERAGRRLFGPLDLIVRGPARIGLLGANGSGKTSLIRIILGEEEPAAGEVWADRSRIALLDQHLSLLGPAGTLLEAMIRHNPEMDIRAAYAALASYGFRNRWAPREVRSLSGGERVRLALACLFSGATPPQMIVLDEPTNHLDVSATEMLEEALGRYDGAILCVSHDTRFRSALRLSETIQL